MSIDKNSSGLPEINVHRPTTKVNLSIIVAVGIFFAVTFAIVYVIAHRHPEDHSSTPVEKTSP